MLILITVVGVLIFRRATFAKEFSSREVIQSLQSPTSAMSMGSATFDPTFDFYDGMELQPIDSSGQLVINPLYGNIQQ